MQSRTGLIDSIFLYARFWNTLCGDPMPARPQE
jgi:hypothetical protein